MNYAIITNDQITAHGDNHTIWPNTSFADGIPNAEFLADQNAVVICSELPYDAILQKLLQVEPYLLAGTVYDVQVVDMTPDELAAALQAKRAAMSCSMRQARLALLQSGLLAQVNPALDAMPEPQRSQASIEWEYATNVQRSSQFVLALGGALGLDDAQIDDLFDLAVTL